MELFVDTDTLTSESAWIKKEFGIDFHKIIELFCPDGNTYISTVAPEVEEILTKLWGLLDIAPPFSISQMKFYALALFSLMQNLNDIPPSQACTFFTETQVDIAKRVEKIITSDLRQHHPAWELAAQFSVSETSLKNYFRGVFGQNISFYLNITPFLFEIKYYAAISLFSCWCLCSFFCCRSCFTSICSTFFCDLIENACQVCDR